jgi:hypothetical protein
MAATDLLRTWDNRRTEETGKLEKILSRDFQSVEAYRFNSASIRFRIVDSRFEGKSIEEREDWVMPLLLKLPKRMREDILMLLMRAPSELETRGPDAIMNHEFDYPLPSTL